MFSLLLFVVVLFNIINNNKDISKQIGMSKTQKMFSIIRTAMISENSNDRLRELNEVEK
jgi:hypothetical protein